MDKETVKYIIKYFSHLLTSEEKMAIKHTNYLFDVEDVNHNSALNAMITRLYKNAGWLTENESILNLLNDGYDNFEIRTAEWMLSKFSDEIFLNYCPNCGKLARTPYAKQCRHCACNWH